MNKLYIFDFTCGETILINDWDELAQKTLKMNKNDNERFLPFLNGTALVFPNKNESAESYKERLIDQAAKSHIAVK